MKLFVRLILCSVLLFCAAGIHAQDDDKPKDAEGCKPSPLLSLFPGGHINSCDNKEFETADFPLATGPNGEEHHKHLEGEFHSWDIATRPGVSPIQVYRNFENAMKAAGITIDYANPPDQLVGHKGKTWISIDNHGDFYYQTIITEQAMTQEVTADASSLNDEISKTGHVAVYGIHFDTGKSAILPDSEDSLKQILALLNQNAALKLRVEGHTDNQGAPAANQTLSEKRAQAVMGWLIANGIDSARLSAKGFGQTKPVADNSTEEGRAKNRRVELVKQ
jgi:outer membrane protein OmpA-like peptidoglycan-associated protein